MARSSPKSTPIGVGVDDDATPLGEPVTVLVSPAGNEYDADTWADAYNLLGSGYAIKDGHPTGPIPTEALSGTSAPDKAEPGHAAATASTSPGS